MSSYVDVRSTSVDETNDGDTDGDGRTGGMESSNHVNLMSSKERDVNLVSGKERDRLVEKWASAMGTKYNIIVSMLLSYNVVVCCTEPKYNITVSMLLSYE